MTDPSEWRAELDQALEVAAAEARGFLARLDDDPVQPGGSEDAAVALGGELPEDGEGAPAAIGELGSLGRTLATRSAGPRFFHFVIGGATPAALAADWLTASSTRTPAPGLAPRLRAGSRASASSGCATCSSSHRSSVGYW